MNSHDEKKKINSNLEVLNQITHEIKAFSTTDKITQENLKEDKEPLSFIETIKEISFSAANITVSLLVMFLLETINIIFIGTYGDKTLLTAIGLGTFVTNMIGYLPVSGWPGGIDTLCSNANGLGKAGYKKISIYVTICLLAVFAYLCIIEIPLYCYSYRFFKLINQPDNVSEICHMFNLLMIPATFFFGFYQTFVRYLQSIQIFDLSVYTTIITLLLHPIWAYIFIIKLDYKVEGAAIAMGITQFLNVTIILSFILFKIKQGVISNETFQLFSKESFYWINIKTYLGLAVPSLILFMVEAFSFEVMAIICSFLTQLEMSVNVCLFNFLLILYSISNGIGMAACSFVGNFVGNINAKYAYHYAKSALIYAASLGFSLSVLSFIFRYKIAEIYTNTDENINLFVKLFPFIVFPLFIDYSGVVIIGICKGLGRQKLCSICYLITQYCFGIPFTLFLTFYMEWHIFGAYTAYFVNICLIAFGQSFVLYSKSFESTVEEFKQSVELENKKLQSSEQTPFLKNATEEEKFESERNNKINKKI